MKKVVRNGFAVIIAILMLMLMSINSVAASAAAEASGGGIKIKVSYSDQSITVSWDKVSGINKYYIYRAGDWQEYEMECIATTNKNYYVDKGAFTDYQYGQTTKALKYAVVYYEDNDLNNLPMKEAGEKSVSLVPKNKVKLSASTSCSTISLSWSRPSDATGCRVYQKVGNSWKYLKTTAGTKYTAQRLKPGAKYTFLVKPYNCIDGKYVYGPQNTISVSTKKVGTPSIKASAGKVTWSKVSGVTGYRVYKKTSSGWKKIKDVTGTSLKVSKGTYTVKAYVKYSGKVYWGGYNKRGVQIK